MVGVKEILTDEMLAAAFEFRKTELWDELDDSQIFAVELSNDEIGYCCVMGNNGTHYSLQLYIGDKGFSTYLDMVHSGELSELDLREQSMTYDCISVDYEDEDDEISFLSEEAKNKIRDYARRNKMIIPKDHGWPSFTRSYPGKAPVGIVDKEEAKLIVETLNAATALSKMIDDSDGIEELGFEPFGDYADDEGGKEITLIYPDSDCEYGFDWDGTETPAHIVPEYPAPDYEDDERLDKLDTIKKKGIWQCKVCHFYSPIMDSKDGIPYYPLGLFFTDRTRDYMIPPVLLDEDGDDIKMVDGLADAMINNKMVPLTIEVNDPRTYGLLQDFCVQEGINLNRVARLTQLDRLRMFINQAMQHDPDDENQEY